MGIRFIDLREKLGCFAFYDTTVDRFTEYNGNQTWTNWEYLEYDHRNDSTTVASDSCACLKNYCPDWVFEKRRI